MGKPWENHGKPHIHLEIFQHLGILGDGLVQHAAVAKEGGSLGEVVLGLRERRGALSDGNRTGWIWLENLGKSDRMVP